MAWWDKVKSAAKSAVNKAVKAVKKVKKTVKKIVRKTVETVKKAVKKVKKRVKRSVSKKVKKVKSSVKKVKNTVKKVVAKVVDKVIDSVAVARDTAKIIAEEALEKAKVGVETAKELARETAEKALEKVKEKIKEIEWRTKLFSAIKSAMKAKLSWLGLPSINIMESIYEFIIGRKLTEAESIKFQLKLVDWIVPLNALSKLFFGKNLDGKEEEFGSVMDYTDLVLGLAIVVPVGKVGVVAGKLGVKAGTTFGLKGFMKFAVTNPVSAGKLFKILKVDDQTKLIGKLIKTDEGIKIINVLLSKKALHKTLVKPTISLVNKAIAERILRGAGFGALVQRSLKPKTILWGLSGMAGIIGLAYGIPFGTSWMAKEGIKEQFEIPLSDRMRDYRYEPTKEKREIILRDIKKLREALPIAEATIRSVAWLWPPTKEIWEFYAENIYFTIEQIEKELEIKVPLELIVIPEKVEATVRDIIDGDTIDVDLAGKNLVTLEEIKLPEYRTTGHARIRIVGINAPEKSPKGEILCSDVEIFKVEKEFADESRDRLLHLNDKKVILKIDPETPIGTHGRILAVVEYFGIDIGLRQIREGLACGYYREPHKYYDEDYYSEATLTAKDEGIGMWKGLEEVEKEEEKIRIKITSEPTNSRLFLDDIALHHNTPSDEIELSDVLHLFTLGKHVISAEKGGLSFMGDIEITKGDNGTLHLVLETAPIPEVPTEEEIIEEELEEEVVEEEKEEEEIIEPVVGPVKPGEIPKEYTPDQEWALKEAFKKILELTEGRAIMSGKEREELISGFNLYTTEQKVVLDLIWRDLLFYTEGRKQLSADELAELYDKYRIVL